MNLTANNNISAGVSITDATVSARFTSNESGIPTNQPIQINAGGNLIYDAVGIATLSTYQSELSGEGTLTKSGTGTLFVNSDFTVGLVDVEEGFFRMYADSYNGDMSIANGATLALHPSFGEVTLAANITGEGRILPFTSILNITGTQNFTGTIDVSSRRVKMNTSALASNPSVNLSGALGLFQMTDNNDATLSSRIYGPGTLEKLGEGTTTLTGNNSFSVLEISSGGIICNSGSLPSNDVEINGNGTLIIDEDDDVNLNIDFTGSGDFIKRGSGRVNLQKELNLTGDFTIENGAISFFTAQVPRIRNLILNAGGELIIDAVFSDVLITTLTGEGTLNLEQFGCVVSGGSYSGNITGPPNKGEFSVNGDLDLNGTSSFLGITNITGNATLTANATSLPGNEVAISEGAILRINQTSSGEIDTVISGLGSLVKEGASALTLQGLNTYSGGTTILEGSIVGDTSSIQGNINASANTAVIFDLGDEETYAGIITGAGSLQKIGTGNLILTGNNNFTGGTLIDKGSIQTTSEFLTGDVSVSSEGKLIILQEDAGEVSGDITGSGSVEKQRFGDVTFSGNNSFSGGFTVSAGKVIGTNVSFPGTVTLRTVLTTIEFDQNANGTKTGNITGVGNLIKSGLGVLTLTGNNDYTGGTLVNEGTLKGSIGALQGTFNIADGASLNFFQTTDVDFDAGNIEGLGNVIKSGEGTLTFTGDSTYTGDTNLEAGALVVNGSIASQVVINGGVLKGTGSVGSINNVSGVINAGNSIGTLVIAGNFVQGAGGTLELELNPQNSDILQIGGTATLAGTLELFFEPGLYSKGKEYEFLAATGGVLTPFDRIVKSSPEDYRLVYTNNAVILEILRNFSVLSIDFSSLTGNAKKTAEYVFCDAALNPLLVEIQDKLYVLEGNQLSNALKQLCPEQFGAMSYVGFQNNVQMSDIFRADVKNSHGRYYLKQQHLKLTNQKGLWFVPYWLYYNQDGISDVVGFKENSAGFALGYKAPISCHGFVNFGAAYTLTKIKWDSNRGKASSNSLYIGPAIGYANYYFFTGLNVQFSVDFYNVCRKVSFPGVYVEADSFHPSYNFTLGYTVGFNAPLKDQWCLSPEAQLIYVALFERGHTETGGSPLNLHVAKKQATFLQPSFMLNIRKRTGHMNTRKSSKGPNEWQFVPNFGVGWLANLQLSNADYVSTLYELGIVCEKNFTILSYYKNINQLVFDLSLSMLYKDKLSLSVFYNPKFLDSSNIQVAGLKLNYYF